MYILSATHGPSSKTKHIYIPLHRFYFCFRPNYDTRAVPPPRIPLTPSSDRIDTDYSVNNNYNNNIIITWNKLLVDVVRVTIMVGGQRDLSPSAAPRHGA